MDVVKIVKRLAAVFFRFLLEQIFRINQQKLGEVAGRFGGIYFPPKSVFAKLGQAAGVVNMSMRDQNGGNFRRIVGKRVKIVLFGVA